MVEKSKIFLQKKKELWQLIGLYLYKGQEKYFEYFGMDTADLSTFFK